MERTSTVQVHHQQDKSDLRLHKIETDKEKKNSFWSVFQVLVYLAAFAFQLEIYFFPVTSMGTLDATMNFYLYISNSPFSRLPLEKIDTLQVW